jgi:hypothetical protein
MSFPKTSSGADLNSFGLNAPQIDISRVRHRVGSIYRHAVFFADEILKGTKPAELPIERASKFQFVLHLETAKALALEVPAATLLRADEVIE